MEDFLKHFEFREGITRWAETNIHLIHIQPIAVDLVHFYRGSILTASTKDLVNFIPRFDLVGHFNWPNKVAKLTNPGNFTMEDIIFTGIMRVKANLTEPDDVRGVCEHHNSNNKYTEIRKRPENSTVSISHQKTPKTNHFQKPWKDLTC